MDVVELVQRTQRRLQLGALLAGLAAGLVALAASIAITGFVWNRPALGATAGLLAAGGLVLAATRRATARWSASHTAAHIEALTPGLDNLLVTATDLHIGLIDASDRMRDEIVRQASARVGAISLPSLAPVAGSLWLLAAALIGTSAVAWGVATLRMPIAGSPDPVAAAGGLQSLLVTITAPEYLKRDVQRIENPEQVSVPAGGRLRIDVRTGTALAWLEEPGAERRPLEAAGDGRFGTEWTPSQSTAIAIGVGEVAGSPVESRLLQVTVAPDEAPRVRITEPGRDLAFTTPTATVDLAIDATDAEGLQAVRVAYVLASGSGESFAFEEGQVPVRLERLDDRRWRGRARLSLSALQLEDGDSLVYRALVRDSNPDADWVSSDAFTIDVGKRLEFAGAGFALPDEDRRYAISQQMVIVKTERLQAERPQVAAEDWAERTRFLAMEQRMVRAEVVFLSGGEVADEVEEAEQSHELQEGRLENSGRAEMLKAINEMSRAEAHLNAGDTVQALVAERAALASLQRAFDRRRYFLRTMTERTRIDPARRLSGDRAKAESHTRQPEREDSADASSLRTLLLELAAVAESGDPAPAALVARLASIEPASAQWRRTAAALMAAATPAERQEAARAAMARVAERGRANAGESDTPPDISVLNGWWFEERREGRQP
jgi:hypothetical protein